MSRKHFGAAVAFAALLTGSQIALAEVEDGSRERAEIFVYGGWELVGAPLGILVVDSNKIADDNRADARNAPRNDQASENYANIPATIRSNTIDSSPDSDSLYLSSTSDKDNSGKVGTSASESARPPISTLTVSSRPLTPRRQARSMLPPAGCARCVREVARPAAGRAKSFAAVFPINFFRSVSVLARRAVTGNARQRDAPLQVGSAPQQGWRNSSL
jgi:hypothetical protein